MATSKSRQNAKHQLDDNETPQDDSQVTHDFVEYLKQYARENPGTAALWCLGIGFVLGWKMKPW
jgi:hypothetical protein